ncbi:hypothetical protein A3SI_04837 [Nitritalea halalkaliphila LW7]|uniref:DUF2141 domain-containing protein n=1 Tax=Nitritalea halalkaliphila LW7 TaxID=1189621 RepID=I5C8E4_9BACT|nr:DUF2141 domain-containing protein [Nitritalea halalkaliphila]EIM78096.1 hypothetical protein A3SI_04837 [Nitritalea halalkaliphila LW7]
MSTHFVLAGFLLMSFFWKLSPEPVEKVSIRIEVGDFESDEGEMSWLLFDKEEGFPNKPEKALKRGGERIKGGKASLTLSDLEKGKRYAVSVFHDKEKNGKLPTSTFGIPKAQYGFTQDAKGRMGPPKFKDAAFTAEKEGATLKIRLQGPGV